MIAVIVLILSIVFVNMCQQEFKEKVIDDKNRTVTALVQLNTLRFNSKFVRCIPLIGTIQNSWPSHHIWTKSTFDTNFCEKLQILYWLLRLQTFCNYLSSQCKQRSVYVGLQDKGTLAEGTSALTDDFLALSHDFLSPASRQSSICVSVCYVLQNTSYILRLWT